jgi:hypothetical protein
MRLLGRSLRAEYVNTVLFRFATVSKLRRFNVHFAYYCDRLTRALRRLFSNVQLVEAQLSDSDSSTGNKDSDSSKNTLIY